MNEPCPLFSDWLIAPMIKIRVYQKVGYIYIYILFRETKVGYIVIALHRSMKMSII